MFFMVRIKTGHIDFLPFRLEKGCDKGENWGFVTVMGFEEGVLMRGDKVGGIHKGGYRRGLDKNKI